MVRSGRRPTASTTTSRPSAIRNNASERVSSAKSRSAMPDCTVSVPFCILAPEVDQVGARAFVARIHAQELRETSDRAADATMPRELQRPLVQRRQLVEQILEIEVI